jgi:hypothetical protein
MTALIELYANNAYSTIGSPITSSGQTTITVTNGAVFPSPTSAQFFRLTITLASAPNTVIEIVYVTARSGNNLTVLRGQEGTTATTWVTGSLVGNEATAGSYNQFVQPSVGVDTGAVNAYVVSTPQHESAYYTGMPCTFYTIHSSTSTTPTLNLNGLGTATIKNADGTPLLSGQIIANTPISVVYNSADTSWRMQSPIGIPTGLTPSRAAGIDPSGRVTSAAPSLAQLNMLSNWLNPMQESDAGDGWIKMPTGLIIQWGSHQVTSNPTAVFFPIPFPTNMLSVVVSEGAASGAWGGGNPTIHGASPSDGNAYYGWAFAWNGTGWSAPFGGGITQNFIAIGY